MRSLLLALFMIFLSLSGSSQTWRYVRNEISFGVGASNFLGDLGGSKGIGSHGIKDLRVKPTRPSLSIGYKYMITPAMSVRAIAIWGYLSGDDALTQNAIRNNRNLSFRSMLGEFSALFEYYPGGDRPFTRATFAVRQNGRLTEAWLPDRMEAIDATGNEPWVPMVTYEATNNLAAYEIQATSLSPSEVWKLRVRFAKERDSAPEKMWTSPDLAVEDGVVAPVSLTTNWQAGDLTLETSEDPFPKTIILRLYPLPDNTRLKVAEFVDDRGRKVEYEGGSFEDSGFHVKWKIPDKAAWVRITVRLVETRNFEYVAQPTRQ